MSSVRTDLAIEAHEMYCESSVVETDIDGVDIESEENGESIRVTRVHIRTAEGERKLGKAVGNYITIEVPDRFYDSHEVYEEACHTCAKELKRIVKLKKDDTVLVVGLGNRNITADSLGPKVVQSLMITRHLKKYIPEEIDERIRPVCAITPGVLGLTGIETSEVIQGICEKISPDLLIVIDALCSRRMERLNRTIQISDTGITPGAGVGNIRMSIDKKTLGVPVIALGVPTVVDAATIASDSIDLLIENLKENAQENAPLYKMLATIREDDKIDLIRQVIAASHGDFVVASKDVDAVVEDISAVVANGINISLHDGIGLEDVDKYI